MATNHITLEAIQTWTGKLNKIEKGKVNSSLVVGKSLGQILNEISIHRANFKKEIQAQDVRNSKIKNPCLSSVALNLKVDSQTNELNKWEIKDQKKKEIKQQTDQFINLQNKPKRQRKTKEDQRKP